jgi:Anti-sigma regulatory factor (Ser/Thr protein kinase)
MTGHERTWHIPRQREAVSDTRRDVRKTLADWGMEDAADDIGLIISELLGNAVVHGEPEISLTLAVRDECVCGKVVDHGPGMPQPRTPTDNAEGGRGLAIVEAYTRRWGVTPLPDGPGKCVWFECCCSALDGAR